MPRLPLILLPLLLSSICLSAAAPPTRPIDRDYSVEELTQMVRRSVVVITTRGRDGKTDGLGAGFVLSRDGLIATNWHVIGEGRAVSVKLADGTRHNVISVHATDRANDLAILRVAARNLEPLPLGDATRLRDGQPVVAMGNPKGLEHSVVAGIVSGRRQVEGRSMIQVAIPIEPGNSGGPLLNRRGQVVGIMTIKSLVTANLGFAVSSNALLPLIKKPNPVPMSAWLTIGALDPDEWTLKGGQWRQRAGRIISEGRGAGIGGRALCLSSRTVPALPFEVSVAVRLEDESGAAGLAFHADGEDRHYGFYPSNGKFRFTQFNGPDVFSWKVLVEKPSPHYRPGEWNVLKVRVEKGQMRCFVNDEPVFVVEDDAFTEGKVGLCKFRETTAEFRHFRLGKELPAARPSAALLAKITKAMEGLKPIDGVKPELLKKFPAGNATTLAALREKARLLEQQAAQLRQVALLLHQQEVLGEMARLIKGKDADIDLVHAALLIARLDNDEVDVDAYRAEVERMARKVKASLPRGAGEKEKLSALERYLFREKGFHGSRADYYNRSNSYLSEVIDDREGLPITLSLLYLELAGKLGVRVEGVGLPGHFVVRHVPAKGRPELIDVYEGAARMTRAEADRKVRSLTGRPLEDDDLKAVTKKQILVRMLHNLLGVARQQRDTTAALRYLDGMLTIIPDGVEERGMRAAMRFQAGDLKGAKDDVEWLYEKRPDGIDLERVEQMRRYLDRMLREKE